MASAPPTKNYNIPLPLVGAKRTRTLVRNKFVRLLGQIRRFETMREHRNWIYPEKYNYELHLLPNGLPDWVRVLPLLKTFNYLYCLCKYVYRFGPEKARRQANAFWNMQRYEAHRDVIYMHMHNFGIPGTVGWNYRLRFHG